MNKIQTIDKRFPLDQPTPAGALDADIGWPRDNRYLVLGRRLDGPHDPKRDQATDQVRAALRGKRDAIIVQSNYCVDGYAAIGC
jgi:hypothetical protein